MKHFTLIAVAGIFLVMLALPGLYTTAQSPTPTPTRTPTFTNEQLIRIGTVVPPPQCGGVYVPCGPLPYQVPPFPTLNLPSPTVVDYYGAIIGATSGPTNTPGGPTTTPQPTLDRPAIGTLGAGVNNMVSTMSAQGTAYTVNGTPVSVSTLASSIGSNAGAVFAYAKGMQDTFMNIGGVIPILLGIIAFMVLIIVATTILPIIFSVARFLLQLFEALTP